MSTAMRAINRSHDAFIFLEKRIYYPGDLLIGTLELELTRKLCCDLITVKLFGSARVFFTDSKTDQTHLNKTIGYEQEKVLIDLKNEIWKAEQARNPARELSIDEIVRLSSSTSISPRRVPAADSAGLEPGRYKFQFSFQLPDEGLETSFDAKHSAGCIRYYIQMEATRDGFAALRKKLLFPIVRPTYLGANKEALRGFESEETFHTRKGAVTVKLTLPCVGFVPGEPVVGEIMIKNGTDRSIKYSHLSLIQRALCYSTYPEVKIKETFFQTAGMGLPISKVTSGDTYTYAIQFYISALAPTFKMVEILCVDYYLKLDVGFTRNCPSKSLIVSIKAPIVIGAYSPFNSPAAVGPSSNEETPPEYSESPSSLDAPPPYSTCCSDVGLSSLPGADNADLDGYTPLYHQLGGGETEQLLRNRR